jgi:hypothetical protein
LANRLWKSAGTAPWYSTTCPTAAGLHRTGRMPQAASSAVATIKPKAQPKAQPAPVRRRLPSPSLRFVRSLRQTIGSTRLSANVLHFPCRHHWSIGKQSCGETDQTSCAARQHSSRTAWQAPSESASRAAVRFPSLRSPSASRCSPWIVAYTTAPVATLRLCRMDAARLGHRAWERCLEVLKKP